MRTGPPRRRLTTGTLAIAAALILALDVAVAVSLQHHLDGGLRQRLENRAALAAELGPGHPERRREELTGDGIDAEILGHPTTTARVPAAPPRPVGPVRRTGEQLRITPDVGGGMTVVLTASQRPIERTMRTVVLIEGSASIVLLAIAGFAVRAAVRARRAVRAEEAMRRFLEDAGHDLRTPAANISASGEALLRGDCRRHEREELEVAMIRESQRMGRLVADLVARAREQGADSAAATVDAAAATVDAAAATADAATATVDLTSVVRRGGDASPSPPAGSRGRRRRAADHARPRRRDGPRPPGGQPARQRRQRLAAGRARHHRAPP